MTKEILDIVEHLGKVKMIRTAENDAAIEIWAIFDNKEECELFYLFDYQRGVIEVE